MQCSGLECQCFIDERSPGGRRTAPGGRLSTCTNGERTSAHTGPNSSHIAWNLDALRKPSQSSLDKKIWLPSLRFLEDRTLGIRHRDVVGCLQPTTLGVTAAETPFQRLPPSRKSFLTYDD